MDFLPRINELPSPNLDVLIHPNRQVIVGARFDFTIGINRVVFFCFEFRVAVLLDGVVTLVADADLLVMLDVLVPITLGVQVDFLDNQIDF